MKRGLVEPAEDTWDLFHVPNAIKNGVTEEELVELVTHLAFYIGWPNAMSAVNRVKALFEKRQDA